MSNIKRTFIEFIGEGKKESVTITQALLNQIIDKITNKNTKDNIEFTFKGIRVVSKTNTSDYTGIDLYKSNKHIIGMSFDYMTKELVINHIENIEDVGIIASSFSRHYTKIKYILDGKLNQELAGYLYDKYTDILDKYFTIHIYDEDKKKCGLELESWTSDIGINQINFLDLREDDKNIFNIEDLHNEFNSYFISDYDMEDDYKNNLNDKSFKTQFDSPSGKKKVLRDIKNWYTNVVMKCKKELDKFVEEYSILNGYVDYDKVDNKA